MIFRFASKYNGYFIASELSKITQEQAAIEIIKHLENNKFDYYKQTYIPTQEEKKFFFHLFEKKINHKLQSRMMDQSIKRLMDDKWPTKNVTWKNKKIALLKIYDRAIIKWILHYEAFYKSYEENINIYIDFFNNELIGYSDKKETIDYINECLAINNKISITRISKKTNTEKDELYSLFKLYEEYGLAIFSNGQYLSLSDRGNRLINSSYKQEF